jgi:hypothetical protein
MARRFFLRKARRRDRAARKIQRLLRRHIERVFERVAHFREANMKECVGGHGGGGCGGGW